jgi:hypothetical protein
VSVAAANFTKHPTALSSSVIGIPTDLAKFSSIRANYYLIALVSLIRSRIRSVGLASRISSFRSPPIILVFLLLKVSLPLRIPLYTLDGFELKSNWIVY